MVARTLTCGPHHCKSCPIDEPWPGFFCRGVLTLRPRMDIFWANAALLALPSSQRVEVLVHDGSTDLRLWPGPGPDRDLVETYGPGLREALEAQRIKAGGSVPIGEVVRIHPGKLHCNYLLWVSTRGPEDNGQRAN